jgi:uncharacterized radical SAM superfamily Fe-S cluster-containing enzyme
MRDGVIAETYSVCPVCLKRIPAERRERDGGVFLERECGEHGFFSSRVWGNFLDFEEWTSGAERSDEWNTDCPNACGLCERHIRGTCCVLLEVTSRCDLSSCAFCFANSGREGSDPSVDELASQMKAFVKRGSTFIQLSGGEPTIRDDLPDIVRAARGLGCKYVQLNTNGLRLSHDEKFVHSLAEAGLSFAFMQFDGTDDVVYEKLRGVPMMDAKKQAIENCARHGIGVTLVPTIVREVNLGVIGEIIRFAVKNSPAVRGVHFQPVCLMGRYPGTVRGENRVTLDELISEIRLQSGALIGNAEIIPSLCDHPLCGFHSDFIVIENKKLYPLSAKRRTKKTGCCSEIDPAARNREFIGKRWASEGKCCCSSRYNKNYSGDMSDMEYFAARAKSHAFTLTAMAFQDAWNLDLERLRSCSLHVFHNGRMIPFCANYLTPAVDS